MGTGNYVRFRTLHRSQGWTKVEINEAEKAKTKTDHLALLGWAQELCGMDDVKATMRKNHYMSTGIISVFAFKNPEHASLFILRWK